MRNTLVFFAVDLKR